MNAEKIVPGMTLKLKPSAEHRYQLTGTYVVSHLSTRDGYKTPWVWVKSRRSDAEILPFRPSDFSGECAPMCPFCGSSRAAKFEGTAVCADKAACIERISVR